MSIRIGIGLDVFGAGIDADATTIYNRIIADGGVSNLTRLNFFVKGLKAIYGDLANVPVCYDAHWIGYKLGSGTGATAGQAAAKLYSLTVAADAVQSTAASQPLLLAHNGDNYWYSPLVTNNFCSTPNISIPTNSGIELDLKINLTSGNIAESLFGWFFSHDNGAGSRPLFIGLGASSTLRVFWNNFTYTANSTASLPSPFNGWLRLKLESVSGNMVVTFSTSSDGITFTQLGLQVTVVGAANTYLTTSVPVYTNSNNGANISSGKYLRAIYKDAKGVTRADFNPATYNASTSQTAWTSSTGEVWTINTGTAASGYKGCLVSRTIVQGDGVDDTMTDTATYVQPYTVYNVGRVENAAVLVKSNSGGGYLSYVSNDTIRMIGGLSLVFANAAISFRKRNLISAVFNGASSVLAFNNSISTTGNAGTDAITTTFLLFDSNNSSQNTIIISSTADNSTTRTAMYNLIRSINENAF